MSWNVSTKGRADSVIDELKVKFEEAYKEPYPEVQEQFNRALDGLLLILPSVQPAPESEVFVSLAGHANREHKKDPAWANDMVSVSVQQV